eukprot:GHVH01004921.1.p1 GENE.GHVH01004921.1~~GHVH01004921.1.p1  ORF type:complete len:2975 (-),score=398.09 GHVH01004921.1:311-7963(-)
MVPSRFEDPHHPSPPAPHIPPYTTWAWTLSPQSPTCDICKRKHGPMRRSVEGAGGAWVHSICVLYGDGGPTFLRLKGRLKPVNISSSIIHNKRKSYRCCLCKSTEGYTVKCKAVHCQHRYHIGCAVSHSSCDVPAMTLVATPMRHSRQTVGDGLGNADVAEGMVERVVTLHFCPSHSHQQSTKSAYLDWEVKQLDIQEMRRAKPKGLEGGQRAHAGREFVSGLGSGLSVSSSANWDKQNQQLVRVLAARRRQKVKKIEKAWVNMPVASGGQASSALPSKPEKLIWSKFDNFFRPLCLGSRAADWIRFFRSPYVLQPSVQIIMPGLPANQQNPGGNLGASGSVKLASYRDADKEKQITFYQDNVGNIIDHIINDCRNFADCPYSNLYQWIRRSDDPADRVGRSKRSYQTKASQLRLSECGGLPPWVPYLIDNGIFSTTDWLLSAPDSTQEYPLDLPSSHLLRYPNAISRVSPFSSRDLVEISALWTAIIRKYNSTEVLKKMDIGEPPNKRLVFPRVVCFTGWRDPVTKPGAHESEVPTAILTFWSSESVWSAAQEESEDSPPWQTPGREGRDVVSLVDMTSSRPLFHSPPITPSAQGDRRFMAKSVGLFRSEEALLDEQCETWTDRLKEIIDVSLPIEEPECENAKITPERLVLLAWLPLNAIQAQLISRVQSTFSEVEFQFRNIGDAVEEFPDILNSFLNISIPSLPPPEDPNDPLQSPDSWENPTEEEVVNVDLSSLRGNLELESSPDVKAALKSDIPVTVVSDPSGYIPLWRTTTMQQQRKKPVRNVVEDSLKLTRENVVLECTTFCYTPQWGRQFCTLANGSTQVSVLADQKPPTSVYSVWGFPQKVFINGLAFDLYPPPILSSIQNGYIRDNMEMHLDFIQDSTGPYMNYALWREGLRRKTSDVSPPIKTETPQPPDNKAVDESLVGEESRDAKKLKTYVSSDGASLADSEPPGACLTVPNATSGDSLSVSAPPLATEPKVEVVEVKSEPTHSNELVSGSQVVILGRESAENMKSAAYWKKNLDFVHRQAAYHMTALLKIRKCLSFVRDRINSKVAFRSSFPPSQCGSNPTFAYHSRRGFMIYLWSCIRFQSLLASIETGVNGSSVVPWIIKLCEIAFKERSDGHLAASYQNRKIANNARQIVLDGDANMEDMDRSQHAYCVVCFNPDLDALNPIGECQKCGVRVHRSCYVTSFCLIGCVEQIHDNFTCHRCREKVEVPHKRKARTTVKCVVCLRDTGAVKQTNDGRWVHVTCALACHLTPESVDNLDRWQLPRQSDMTWHHRVGCRICCSEWKSYPLPPKKGDVFSFPDDSSMVGDGLPDCASGTSTPFLSLPATGSQVMIPRKTPVSETSDASLSGYKKCSPKDGVAVAEDTITEDVLNCAPLHHGITMKCMYGPCQVACHWFCAWLSGYNCVFMRDRNNHILHPSQPSILEPNHDSHQAFFSGNYDVGFYCPLHALELSSEVENLITNHKVLGQLMSRMIVDGNNRWVNLVRKLPIDGKLLEAVEYEWCSSDSATLWSHLTPLVKGYLNSKSHLVSLFRDEADIDATESGELAHELTQNTTEEAEELRSLRQSLSSLQKCILIICEFNRLVTGAARRMKLENRDSPSVLIDLLGAPLQQSLEESKNDEKAGHSGHGGKREAVNPVASTDGRSVRSTVREVKENDMGESEESVECAGEEESAEEEESGDDLLDSVSPVLVKPDEAQLMSIHQRVPSMLTYPLDHGQWKKKKLYFLSELIAEAVLSSLVGASTPIRQSPKPHACTICDSELSRDRSVSQMLGETVTCIECGSSVHGGCLTSLVTEEDSDATYHQDHVCASCTFAPKGVSVSKCLCVLCDNFASGPLLQCDNTNFIFSSGYARTEIDRSCTTADGKSIVSSEATFQDSIDVSSNGQLTFLRDPPGELNNNRSTLDQWGQAYRGVVSCVEIVLSVFIGRHYSAHLADKSNEADETELYGECGGLSVMFAKVLAHMNPRLLRQRFLEARLSLSSRGGFNGGVTLLTGSDSTPMVRGAFWAHPICAISTPGISLHVNGNGDKVVGGWEEMLCNRIMMNAKRLGSYVQRFLHAPIEVIGPGLSDSHHFHDMSNTSSWRSKWSAFYLSVVNEVIDDMKESNDTEHQFLTISNINDPDVPHLGHIDVSVVTRSKKRVFIPSFVLDESYASVTPEYNALRSAKAKVDALISPLFLRVTHCQVCHGSGAVHDCLAGQSENDPLMEAVKVDISSDLKLALKESVMGNNRHPNTWSPEKAIERLEDPITSECYRSIHPACVIRSGRGQLVMDVSASLAADEASSRTDCSVSLVPTIRLLCSHHTQLTYCDSMSSIAFGKQLIVSMGREELSAIRAAPLSRFVASYIHEAELDAAQSGPSGHLGDGVSEMSEDEIKEARQEDNKQGEPSRKNLKPSIQSPQNRSKKSKKSDDESKSSLKPSTPNVRKGLSVKDGEPKRPGKTPNDTKKNLSVTKRGQSKTKEAEAPSESSQPAQDRLKVKGRLKTKHESSNGQTDKSRQKPPSAPATRLNNSHGSRRSGESSVTSTNVKPKLSKKKK